MFNYCVSSRSRYHSFLTTVRVSHWTDTATRLAATKAVAADANATAIDVLERLRELNLNLHGLQRNYSELEDTVNAANKMIQDPEKNSKMIFLVQILFLT